MTSTCDICGCVLSKFEDLDVNGNPVYSCPNECSLERAIERVPEYEDSRTKEEISRQIDAAYEKYRAGLTPKSTHCWVIINKKLCPGNIIRTDENSDHPYGHFCPHCGHSLRDHPIYGEGKSRDRAK